MFQHFANNSPLWTSISCQSFDSLVCQQPKYSKTYTIKHSNTEYGNRYNIHINNTYTLIMHSNTEYGNVKSTINNIFPNN